MEDHQVQAVAESSRRLGGIGSTTEALLLDADRRQHAHSLRRLLIEICNDLKNLRHQVHLWVCIVYLIVQILHQRVLHLNH